MTTMTEAELAEKLATFLNEDNDPGDAINTVALARRAAELLGVDLVQDYPEPGTMWIHRPTRRPYFYRGEGYGILLGADGDAETIALPQDWRHHFTPARVVPADQPTLPDSEAVWQAIVNSRRSDGARLTATDATDAVMALLHGEGVETMPTRDHVRAAVDRHLPLAKWDVSGPKIVDAVMALLEDGPRG